MGKQPQKPKTKGEELLHQAEGLEAAAKLAPFIGLFGKRGRKLAATLRQAEGLAAQAREMMALPGRFNAIFGPLGWIAYEWMDADLLRQAVELGGAGRVDEAEELLTDAFGPESLRIQLSAMVAVEAYRPRDSLLRLAAVDYEAERYHAVVPVVLAQIDGIVADVVGKSLFTKTDRIVDKLVAWDSISAGPGGLPDLALLMASPRPRTTDGPLDLPYRHGILHGRDLGYANKKVAAKAWAALFVLREWATKYERGQTEPPPVEPQPGWREILDRMAQTERQRKAIDAWRARPESGPLSPDADPETGAPEAAMMRWLSAWRDRDFMGMAEWTQVSMRKYEPDMAASLEEDFGERHLAWFQLVKIRDIAAAMTEIAVDLRFDGDDPPTTMTANVIFEGPDGSSLVRGTVGGRWGVNEVSALR